jgi:dTDP-4-dehydrorhamnose 3,5-epimerase-like enzyme
VRGRCRGILNAAVDARPDTPTFGRHATIKLSEENNQFFVL